MKTESVQHKQQPQPQEQQQKITREGNALRRLMGAIHWTWDHDDDSAPEFSMQIFLFPTNAWK